MLNAFDLAEKLVKHFEGCRLEAYQDSAGVWTIGWGHTGNVSAGERIDQDTADRLLAADLTAASLALEAARRTLPEARRPELYRIGSSAALISFTFNLGPGALRQLLAHTDVGGQIERWVHAGGQVLPGLVKRRAIEAFIFSLESL